MPPKWGGQLKRYYQIGEVAERAHLTVDTIRFYEKIGLVRASKRNDRDYRLFSEKDLAVIETIPELQGLGFSLREIGDLLRFRRDPKRACLRVRNLIEKKLSQIQQKLENFRGIEAELRSGLEQCNLELQRSPLLRSKCPFLRIYEING